MTPGTPSNLPMTLQLDPDLFQEVSELYSWESDADVARALGISNSHVQRIRTGQQVPGPLFIGSFMYVVSWADFRQVFEIVPATGK